MFQLKVRVLCFLTLAYLLSSANADCSLTLHTDPPLLTKKIGKKTFRIPMREGEVLPLGRGETVEAYCSKGINLNALDGNNFPEDKLVKNIEIGCTAKFGSLNLYYRTLESFNYENNREHFGTPSTYLNCIQEAASLFENNVDLPNCSKYTSFSIGTALSESKGVTVADICFDFETSTVKYVKYLAHRQQYEDLNENHTKSNSPESPIKNLGTPVQSFKFLFKDLSQQVFNDSLKEKKLKNVFLGAQEFDLLNLVQDDLMEIGLESFEYLMNTVWWRSLRLGSWRNFLNALKKRTETVKYIVYSGTSGRLIIPSTSSSQLSEAFTITGSNGKNFNVPEIIWAYVKPIIPNAQDEFVVYGYNSPFHTINNETIRCTDICNGIDWLQNDHFGKVNLLPTFGVVHCCRPRDIANQLDAFPVDELTTESATTELPNGKF